MYCSINSIPSIVRTALHQVTFFAAIPKFCHHTTSTSTGVHTFEYPHRNWNTNVSERFPSFFVSSWTLTSFCVFLHNFPLTPDAWVSKNCWFVGDLAKQCSLCTCAMRQVYPSYFCRTNLQKHIANRHEKVWRFCIQAKFDFENEDHLNFLKAGIS
jgi:hypothetical protein